MDILLGNLNLFLDWRIGSGSAMLAALHLDASVVFPWNSVLPCHFKLL